ncbi:hypothetical protein IW261DRAFT_1678030 [Armillaria novae-zelandiae]|uniref:Uncharacterized protein n=1 Tax=Armillaria novae-zelandiae TaxID=153914 RepID=A0AA39PDQ4_9AGAR|nr:hypothetical protein IW261DRAFT_1678030 [Armillaria novae-zelandiae]
MTDLLRGRRELPDGREAAPRPRAFIAMNGGSVSIVSLRNLIEARKLTCDGDSGLWSNELLNGAGIERMGKKVRTGDCLTIVCTMGVIQVRSGSLQTRPQGSKNGNYAARSLLIAGYVKKCGGCHNKPFADTKVENFGRKKPLQFTSTLFHRNLRLLRLEAVIVHQLCISSSPLQRQEVIPFQPFPSLTFPNEMQDTSYSSINGIGTAGLRTTAGSNYPQAFNGSNDPYNLVTVNQGGVLVHSALCRRRSGSGQFMLRMPLRKQIIGFEKFSTWEDVLSAQDLLQGMIKRYL